MNKLVFQTLNLLIGTGTAILGTIQLLYGQHSPLYKSVDMPEFPILDSNLRFFGGLGLGIGLILLWIIPKIEKEMKLFRAVWICAFLGGIGRLISFMVAGSPSTLLMIFTVLEVAGAPLIILWHKRIVSAEKPEF